MGESGDGAGLVWFCLHMLFHTPRQVKDGDKIVGNVEECFFFLKKELYAKFLLDFTAPSMCVLLVYWLKL